MQGIGSLQDLKKKLLEAGFEVQSHGWYLNTVHGCWTMVHGVVFINDNPIKTISDAKVIKKKVKKEKKSTKAKKQ